MHPFVDYIAHHPAVLADHHPLSEAEQDELFDALNQPGLPETCMTAEMADGFLTGCALSPHAVDLPDWLEAVLGQPDMPHLASAAEQDRLLLLLLRRWRDIQHAFAADTTERVMNQGTEVMFTPLIGQVDPQEVIHPVQLDDEGRRVGEWLGRDWAVGFFSAIQRDDTWQHLLGDDEHWPMVAPVLRFFQGHDPKAPDHDLDHDPEALADMIRALYRIGTYWRRFNRALKPH
jgi:uncharacterized protein